jgi:GTP-binding protein
MKSIQRCDIALIVLDAPEGIMVQDQKIAGTVNEYGKGAIFILNKWDLLVKSEDTYRALLDEVSRKMWFMQYAPVLTISALEKKRVTKVFPLIEHIMKERKKRIPTAALNRLFRDLQSVVGVPSYRGKPVKMNYLTQVATDPPSFAIFIRHAAAIKDFHKRHIEKILRSSFSFAGTPIRISIREQAGRK